MFFCLLGCQTEVLSNETQLILNSVKTGASHELDVKVHQDSFYHVAIYSFDSKELAQNKLVFFEPPLSERINEYIRKNNYYLPITITTSIINKNTGVVISKTNIKNPTTNATGSGRITILAESYLISGDYLIKIDVIEGNQELSNFYNKIVFYARSAK